MLSFYVETGIKPKLGRVVRKPVNANPGLFIVQFKIIQSQNCRTNNVQKTSPKSYKIEIKFLPNPGLA